MNNLPYDATSPASIEAYGKRLVGQTFLDVIHKNNISEKTIEELVSLYGNPQRKGGLGNLLEEVYFGYKANSDPRADFHEAGVELKVTPYKITKGKKYRAGERLVLTMITYDNPVEHGLFTSHLWNKIQWMLLVYYLREKALENNLDYHIDFVKLFTPPKEDLRIIEDDYNKIIVKIEAGLAHELSEGDTMYLGACTKGATAEKSTFPQYYGEHIPARKRAFCFKNSYMSSLFNNYILGQKDTAEKVIPDVSILKASSFEQYITGQINHYMGKTDRELCNMFERDYNNNKAQWIDLSYRMLGIKSNRAEEFIKANIVIKAIRVESNGKMNEHSPLPPMKLMEFVTEEWENSTLCSYFEDTKFLFVVYKKFGGEYQLAGCHLWNIPYNDLHTKVKDGWEQIRKTVASGIKLTKKVVKNGVIIENNLPGLNDNEIIHVRPHSSKRFYILEDGEMIGDGTYADAEQLPDGRWMQKQSFWLNNSYILKQLHF